MAYGWVGRKKQDWDLVAHTDVFCSTIRPFGPNLIIQFSLTLMIRVAETKCVVGIDCSATAYPGDPGDRLAALSIKDLPVPRLLNTVIVQSTKPDHPDAKDYKGEHKCLVTFIRVQANSSRDHCIDLVNAQFPCTAGLIIRNSEHPVPPRTPSLFLAQVVLRN